MGPLHILVLIIIVIPITISIISISPSSHNIHCGAMKLISSYWDKDTIHFNAACPKGPASIKRENSLSELSSCLDLIVCICFKAGVGWGNVAIL